jgi:hypothetical protein
MLFFLYQSIGSTFRLLFPMMSGSMLFVLTATFGMALTNTHELLSIAKTLWFVHIFDLIKIGFTGLGRQRRPVRKHYEVLDSLIQSLNEKFYLELGIIVINIGIALITAFYQACGTFRDGPKNQTMLDILPFFIVHFGEILILCNSATWLTREVIQKYF